METKTTLDESIADGKDNGANQPWHKQVNWGGVALISSPALLGFGTGAVQGYCDSQGISTGAEGALLYGPSVTGAVTYGLAGMAVSFMGLILASVTHPGPNEARKIIAIPPAAAIAGGAIGGIGTAIGYGAGYGIGALVR